jgi:hypothetical protein
MPALFTRMSRFPNAFFVSAKSRRTAATGRRSRGFRGCRAELRWPAPRGAVASLARSAVLARRVASSAAASEAVLRFVLAVLRQRVVQLGGRAQLRNRLTKLAMAERGSQVSNRERDLELAEQRLKNLEQDLKIISKNLARADQLYPVLKAEYESVKREIDQHQQRLGNLRSQVEREDDRKSPEDQVGRALALSDQLERVAGNPGAREELSELLTKLDFLIAFRFAPNRPKARPSRIPVGAMITIGNPEIPIRMEHLHGSVRLLRPESPTGRCPLADNCPPLVRKVVVMRPGWERGRTTDRSLTHKKADGLCPLRARSSRRS